MPAGSVGGVSGGERVTPGLAVEAVDAIDYPIAERFGPGVSTRAQWQTLRTRRFDDEVRAFLARHPDGTVVALGEGLETQYWRVDGARARWLGVDLSEVEQLQRRLLPAAPRHASVADSALDERWLDEVDPSRGVLVTAQGLLMYLDPADVHRLRARSRRCARFPTSPRSAGCTGRAGAGRFSGTCCRRWSGCRC